MFELKVFHPEVFVQYKYNIICLSLLLLCLTDLHLLLLYNVC